MASELGKSSFRIEALLSVALHVALLGALAWYFRNPIATAIVAAGEGTNGGGENVIEVGTVDARALGLTPRSVSYLSDQTNAVNNEDLTTKSTSETDSEVLPSDKPTPNPKDKQTDRPTVQSPKLMAQNPLRGSSTSTSVEVGRTMGSPIPSMKQGIGISDGANLGPNGMPGGSEYGRRIQLILSRNYTPPSIDAGGTQYVKVLLHISRDGQILSLVNGQVAQRYIIQKSTNDLINNAAIRAVLASNPLPPFPNGFLLGAQEAVAEVWFKYPK